MTDVIVETGDLTGIQTQIAQAVASLLEGFEFADALPAILAILVGCIVNGAEDATEATSLAETLGEALIALVEAERPR